MAATDLKETTITTSHGKVHAVTRGSSSNPALLFNHVNSGTWRMFTPLLDSALASRYFLIAYDFLGHGDSDDASEPEASYTIAGYAATAIEVLGHFGVESVAVYGSSLGGHVSVELAMQLAEQSSGNNNKKIQVRGVMVSSSPLCNNKEEAIEGFNLDPDDNIAGSKHLTPEQVEMIVKFAYGGKTEQWMYDTIKRTDSAARPTMIAALMAGTARDHRQFIKRKDLGWPFAVVNGAKDMLCKNEVWEPDSEGKRKIEVGNLWRNQVFILEDSLHTPCWDQPDKVLRLLEEFVADCFAE